MQSKGFNAILSNKIKERKIGARLAKDKVTNLLDALF